MCTAHRGWRHHIEPGGGGVNHQLSCREGGTLQRQCWGSTYLASVTCLIRKSDMLAKAYLMVVQVRWRAKGDTIDLWRRREWLRPRCLGCGWSLDGATKQVKWKGMPRCSNHPRTMTFVETHLKRRIISVCNSPRTLLRLAACQQVSTLWTTGRSRRSHDSQDAPPETHAASSIRLRIVGRGRAGL